MASLGSFTRSAARATFSAYRRVPVRWRLAGGSAALTFVILAGFAAIVGVLTTRQVRSQFNDEVRSAADQLERRTPPPALQARRARLQRRHRQPERLRDGRAGPDPDLRRRRQPAVHPGSGVVSGATLPPATPKFRPPNRTRDLPGARLPGRRPRPPRRHARSARSRCSTPVRCPTSTTHSPASSSSCCSGVLGGTVLALLAGLATAARAIRPIAELTDAAREVERTRDPSRRLPHPEADDEVAELARTLEDMLAALDSARSDTEPMLERQREFVADASHELRTPADQRPGQPRAARRGARRRAGRHRRGRPAFDAADASTGRGPAAAGPGRRQARADAPPHRPGRGAHRGRRRARARGRGPRADGRCRDGRRSRASATISTGWCSTCWRTPSATPRPARTSPPRAGPMAGSRTSPSRTTALGSRLRSASGSSSASSAVAATAGAAPGSVWRSSERSPPRHGGTVSMEPDPSRRGTRFVVALPTGRRVAQPSPTRAEPARPL